MQHHPTTVCRMPHLSHKQNKNTDQIISRRDYHPLANQRKNKQANKNAAQISFYMKLTQTTGPNLGGQTKRKKEFNLLQGKNSTFLEA